MNTTVKACCKINIGLNVVAKLPNGYHSLETVFYPVPLYDEITVKDSTSSEDGISLDGHQLDGDPNDNLALRAVRTLRANGYEIPALHITLCKNIPSGAGLGGGSSDAAAVMRCLNDSLCLGIPIQEMERMLSTLGADCPFFIHSRPLYAEGIGDIFTPVALNLTGWHLLLVKPDGHISTKEAYSAVKPAPSKVSLRDTLSLPVEQWRGLVNNDFEDSVFPQHPHVREIKRSMYELGASYASMSGSGSTVFGLFRDEVTDTERFCGNFVFQCEL